MIYPEHYDMTNEAIPNLTAFDDAALDKAFAALERRRERPLPRLMAKRPWRRFAWSGWDASRG